MPPKLKFAILVATLIMLLTNISSSAVLIDDGDNVIDLFNPSVINVDGTSNIIFENDAVIDLTDPFSVNVSGSSIQNLSDLANVEALTPSDQDGILYNSTTGNWESIAISGAGDITAVLALPPYILGGGTSGSVNIDFNETFLNATIDDRDSDTTYTAGQGLNLTGFEFNHSDTSSQASVDNSGNTFIQDITLDIFGHVTSLVSSTFDFSTIWDAISGNVTSGDTQKNTTQKFLYNDSSTIFFNETYADENTDWLSTFNETYNSLSDSDTQKNSSDFYLFNDTSTIYFNETSLNTTILEKIAIEIIPVWNAIDGNATNYGIIWNAITGNRSEALSQTWVAIDGNSTSYTNGSGLSLVGTEFNHSDTSSQSSVDNSAFTYIQDVTLDTFGHVTSLVSSTFDFSTIWDAISGNSTDYDIIWGSDSGNRSEALSQTWVAIDGNVTDLETEISAVNTTHDNIKDFTRCFTSTSSAMGTSRYLYLPGSNNQCTGTLCFETAYSGSVNSITATTKQGINVPIDIDWELRNDGIEDNGLKLGQSFVASGMAEESNTTADNTVVFDQGDTLAVYFNITSGGGSITTDICIGGQYYV